MTPHLLPALPARDAILEDRPHVTDYAPAAGPSRRPDEILDRPNVRRATPAPRDNASREDHAADAGGTAEG